MRNKKKEKQKSFAFHNAQSIVPLTKLMGDGIIEVDGKYMKPWVFDNVNFKSLGRDEEEKTLWSWGHVLNALEPQQHYKYTILKNTIDIETYKKERFIKKSGEDTDKYVEEWNGMLEDKVRTTNLIAETRYLQATSNSKKLEDAKAFFQRTETALEGRFRELGSSFRPAKEEDYLRDIWNFFHIDSESFFDELEVPTPSQKHNLKNFLAPYRYEVKNGKDYVYIGGKYMRTLYIPPNAYGRYIKDTALDSLSALDISMCISVDIIPMESLDAVKMIGDLEYKTEMNITNYKRGQAKIGNFDPEIPYPMRKKQEQVEEYNQDINERDQRLMLAHIIILQTADTIERLDEDTATLKANARVQGLELVSLKYQQEEGIITALPFGVNRLLDKKGSRLRTLTTEGLSSFIPFTVREVSDENGIYYGVNKVSKSPIFINRKMGMNGNAIIVGSAGAGKSFKNKMEKTYVRLATGDRMIILDPEREYTQLTKAFGGTVIRIAPDSTDYINILDVSATYNEGKNPIPLKSEAVLNFYGMIAGKDSLDTGTKSIIDRCVKTIYTNFVANNYESTPPTLLDLRRELLNQKEDLAREIALELEYYTTGSLSMFSKQTNVDMSNQLICFDISDMGENLMPVAILVIMDFINNVLSKNREEEKFTWIDVDELHLMFQREYTALFFQGLWKRIRKYYGLITGLTQEFTDLAKSETAQSLLNNSDFIIMLSLNDTDANRVAEVMGLDDSVMDYVRNVEIGNGVIKLGNSYIPFEDDFPEETELFDLMRTKIKRKVN